MSDTGITAGTTADPTTGATTGTDLDTYNRLITLLDDSATPYRLPSGRAGRLWRVRRRIRRRSRNDSFVHARYGGGTRVPVGCTRSTPVRRGQDAALSVRTLRNPRRPHRDIRDPDT